MKKQLMTHLYYGDPSEDFSLQLAQTLVKNGADILEIGIPYSDPVCDGEVFQRACLRALDTGTTPPMVLEGIRKLRAKGVNNPIYLTSYFGPIFKYGVKSFVKKAKEVGVQGLVIPDILLEEQKEVLDMADKYDISIVQFATPYSTEKRLKQIISVARGFLYCVSVPGVTGTREKVEQNTMLLIQRVKSLVNKSGKEISVFVGFGISKPEHIRVMIPAGTDGFIVGSAIAKLYENHLNQPDRSLKQIAAFTRALKESTIDKEVYEN